MLVRLVHVPILLFSSAPRGAPPVRLCEEPVVNRETLSRVQADLYRTSDAAIADPAKLIQEQTQLIKSLIGKIIEDPEGPSKVSEMGEAVLNRLVAPELPLLLGRSFPLAARSALGSIKTEEERTALLALSQFVLGVQQEVSEALVELQWRQQQKLRELCDAATEGGTERVLELAEAMREELDTDFCNFLNFAIEEEEKRLEASGQVPFEAPPQIYGGAAPSAAALEEERQEQLEVAARSGDYSALQGSSEGPSLPGGGPPEEQSGVSERQADAWRRIVDGVETPWDAGGGMGSDAVSAEVDRADQGGWKLITDEDVGLGMVSSDADGAASAAVGSNELTPSGSSISTPSDGEGATANGSGSADTAAEQQWLLVLRLVRRGVYNLLAKDYQDDVKHIRLIIGLNSPSAREQLTRSTLLSMNEEQQTHFQDTLQRIGDNLSVQRNAKDLELFNKVGEVRAYVQEYFTDYGGGGMGEFAQM